MKSSKSIVLVHGLLMNPKSWEHWKSFFEAREYVCHTPAYPFHSGEPSEIREKIDPGLGKLSFGNVVSDLSNYIRQLEEKPILIGHSMGGLVVQKLINQDLGIAGICIDSAPPKGIFSTKWSFLKSNLASVNPLKGNSLFLPGVKWFQYAFCNTMTLEETKAEYDKFVVPESRNIPRSSIKKDGLIDFKKAHSPLLFIAGEKDHIIPSSLNRKNFQAYKDPGSKRDFREFPGRTHYLCGQKNWEEIAKYIIDWLDNIV